jgi:hypothetical protein
MSYDNRQTPQLRRARYESLSGAVTPMVHRQTGRRCSAPGCTTVLSRYNPSDRCSAHLGWEDDRKRQHV